MQYWEEHSILYVYKISIGAGLLSMMDAQLYFSALKDDHIDGTHIVAYTTTTVSGVL
jgi:hypothetical protein